MKLAIEIKKLFDDLKNIEYAIFKEIDILEDALNGKDDIDIYVSAKNKKQFITIMKKYGALERETFDRDIKFFYLYIPSIDKLVLFHVHYRLLIGSKRFKEIELQLPYEIEFIENIKIFKIELMLIIAMIRSIYRGELKEDRKLLTYYLNKAQKKIFENYVNIIGIDLVFPTKIDDILLKNHSDFKKFISYSRYIWSGLSIMDYKLRYFFKLPLVKFKKGISLEYFPTDKNVFKRLELQNKKIYKYFGSIVVGKNKISNEKFWRCLVKGIN